MLTLLERVIDPVYNSAQMIQHGFGNDEPPAILKRLQRLYGEPRLGEFDNVLLYLNNSMDQNKPVNVMLRAIKEFHMFLLAHPKAG